MNKVLFSGKTTDRPIRIHDERGHVGYIKSTLTSPRQFIVELNGVYYSGDSGRIRIRGGGYHGKWFKRLYEAKEYAKLILQYVEVYPYPEPKVECPHR